MAKRAAKIFLNILKIILIVLSSFFGVLILLSLIAGDGGLKPNEYDDLEDQVERFEEDLD